MPNTNLPKLTDEQRREALQKAAETRTARAKILADVKAGKVSVEDVISHADDPIYGRMRVRAVLLAIPGVGKSRAEGFMESAKISGTRRIAGLGKNQRANLIEFAESYAK